MLAVLVLLCRMQRGGCSRRGEAEVAVAHADVVSSTASAARSKAVADAEMPKAGHFPLSTASLPALAFALLVMAVFRSNGVIVLVLFLPILFFLVQKSSRKKGSAFGRRCFGGVYSFTEWLKHCPEAGEHECDGKPDRADSAACADVEL